MDIEPKAVTVIKRSKKKYSVIKDGVECAFGDDLSYLKDLAKDMFNSGDSWYIYNNSKKVIV